MKSSRLLVSLLALLFASSISSTLKAQNNVIKFNPMSLAIPNYSFFYERQITPKVTGVLGMNYMNFRNTYTDYYETTGDSFIWQNSLRGPGFTLEGRYFPFNAENDKTPGGFYVGFFTRAIFYEMKSRQDYYSPESRDSSLLDVALKGSYVSFGPTLGYQILINKIVAIDLYLSPDLNVVSTSADVAGSLSGWSYNFDILQQSAVFPGIRFGIAAGIAF